MAAARNIMWSLAAVVLVAAAASAQSPEIGYGADVILRNRAGQAIGSDGMPLRVSPATASAAQPVTQSGAWAISPNRGVATTCAGAGSIGTASTLVCAAGPARGYLALQNQSDAATVYCNMMGGAATLGPPSRKLLPNASLVQGNAGGGFVSTAAINCIASAAATPLSAEVLQ